MAKNNNDQDSVNKWQKLDEESLKQEAEMVEDTVAAADDLPGVEPEKDNFEGQVLALEQQMASYKEKALLAYAELENVRKRSERDVESAHRYANEKILVELLPVIDSLVRALEGEVPTDPQALSMRQGVELTLELLEKILSKFGVQVVDPTKGDVFNPDMHEAMSMIPDAEMASGSIVQVLQKGYQLNGRVVRAAMVIVAQ